MPRMMPRRMQRMPRMMRRMPRIMQRMRSSINYPTSTTELKKARIVSFVPDTDLPDHDCGELFAFFKERAKERCEMK